MASPEIVTTELPYREEAFRARAVELDFSAVAAPVAAELPPADHPVSSFRYRVVKPLLDLTLVFLSLPLVLPLSLLVAALVRLTSSGPVLYRHRRIGQFEEPIYVWKFRTMYQNGGHILEEHLSNNPEAREEWANSQKLRDDPRVTPVGRLLRKTSLDEIPQLINILAGDMSLVGPRPIVDDEREKYGDHFRHYTYAVPGITGLWQVSGRSDVDYNQRVLMDVEYVDRWTLWMEIKIILKTFRVLLHGRGAY